MTTLARESDRISIGGSSLDLREFDEAVAYIAGRAASRDVRRPPLAVASVNLDHIHHFGAGAPWTGVLDSRHRTAVEWLQLIDGAPLAAQARRLTGRPWPRLAGSDLIGPTLEAAQRNGVSVGFLGGTDSTHDLLRARLEQRYPDLRVTGFWAPGRDELNDPGLSRAIAREIAATHTGILVVGLGKPRQELWISRYGAETEARVLLAFGAVVDFLAGRVSRAPAWFGRNGLEWLWRLALEPRRLASRYLLEDPPAYLAVRRSTGRTEPEPPRSPQLSLEPRGSADGRFLSAEGRADVAVVVMADAAHPDRVSAIRREVWPECRGTRLRFITCGEGSVVAPGGGFGPNIIVRGTATGTLPLRSALRHVGESDTVLVIGSDAMPETGMVAALLRRMMHQDAGIVVPRLVTHSGRTLPTQLIARGKRSSEVFEPTDARVPERYGNAHRIDGDIGGILLIHRDVVDSLGLPDGVDAPGPLTEYFSRARSAGFAAWFEPDAIARVHG